jgi:hypothetical protein
MNRFDLEQEIMNCWSVVDDINALFIKVCEEQIDPDELQNYLLGLKTIYQVKFEQLFHTFETVTNLQEKNK